MTTDTSDDGESVDETIRRLGPCQLDSPLSPTSTRFVSDDSRVLRSALTWVGDLPDDHPRPSFELAGPRERLHFKPGDFRAALVTCGGICPGLNNVIRAVVLTLWHHYGCRSILGFRYGYKGMVEHPPEALMHLDPDSVTACLSEGGTLLGTSRGAQSIDEMVATLRRHKVDMLFTIGGDGTLRGAQAIEKKLKELGLPIGVIALPKTIDNDIPFVEPSFGFTTAVAEATRAISSAHAEAKATLNGIGLVKLMGRHAGFIAASATLARSDVNFCLIPEVPVELYGEYGLLRAIERRLDRRRHAVIVVAEGFGQDLILGDSPRGTDPSGNPKLADVGPWLKDRITEHMNAQGKPLSLKYIDPSYIIRSVPANPHDSEYCHVFGQHAVHAAMTGRSGVMIGHVNHSFVHVPIPAATKEPRRIHANDPIWQRVLEATGQASCFPTPPAPQPPY